MGVAIGEGIGNACMGTAVLGNLGVCTNGKFCELKLTADFFLNRGFTLTIHLKPVYSLLDSTLVCSSFLLPLNQRGQRLPLQTSILNYPW